MCGFNIRSGSTVYCELEEEVLASNKASSLKHCLRISDCSFIEGFHLVICYIVRCDLARDVSDLFNPTYKIGCCDWI